MNDDVKILEGDSPNWRFSKDEKDSDEIIKENNPDVLLTAKDEFKSTPIPLNLNEEGNVEVGGVLNLNDDELRKIPTSTFIPKLDNLIFDYGAGIVKG